MWNGSIQLIETIPGKQNENGFTEERYEYLEEIPANISDATRTDEVVGNQCGYKADIAVEIVACNYNGQAAFKEIETGRIYDVKRTYRKPGTMNIAIIGEMRECGKI